MSSLTYPAPGQRYWDPALGQFVDCDYVDAHNDCNEAPPNYGRRHRHVKKYVEPIRIPPPVKAKEVYVSEPVRQQMNQERMAQMRQNIVNVVTAPLAPPPANRLPRDGTIARALAIAVSAARV